MKWVIVGVVVIGLMAFGYYRLMKSKTSEVTYKEIVVQTGSIHLTILSTGVVQPKNRLEIKPPIAGRIERVLVAEGDYVKKGTVLAWMSSTERAALIDVARAKGKEELQYWESMYQETPILAPISGTIIVHDVKPGQTFTNQDAVFVMSDQLTVKAQVDETDIGQIKLKQTARIVLDAYPDKPIPGQVDEIAFEATTVNNVTTYIVDVIPKSVPPFMRSGMTANVTFEVAAKEDVLLIPAEAVKVRDKKSYILTRADKEQIEIEIQPGLSDGKQIEVTVGLSKGDIVLVPELEVKEDAATNKGNPLSPFSSRPRKH